MVIAIIAFLLVTTLSCLFSRAIINKIRIVKLSIREVIQEALNPNLFGYVDLAEIEPKRNPLSELGSIFDKYA
jgi:hypothetical protein